METQVLYAAPGAGLGHLVRACAVSLQLSKEGIRARIVTNSLFAEGMRRLTHCAIDFIPSIRWVRDIPDYVAAVKPGLVVVDTFPWGLRGEWTDHKTKGLRFATIARRLNVRNYLDAASLEWDTSSPHVEKVIVSEPLAEDHKDLLQRGGSQPVTLPGRIRFPAEDFRTPVPEELSKQFLRERVWLIVHTGPEAEIRTLLKYAEEDMKQKGCGVIAAILPRPSPRLGCGVFEYFPASGLYSRAFRVITAAGYGSLADMAQWTGKHLCVPFQRRYDDQTGRLHDGAMTGVENGVHETCRVLSAWL